MKTWALQDAKARLSELIRAAEREPQIITLHGVPRVEVRAVQPRRKGGRAKTLLDVLKACPKDESFELPRRRAEPMRKVEFD
jgi:prevent-host-death family protein